MSNNLLFDSSRIKNQRKRNVIIYVIIIIIAILVWLPGSWFNQNFFAFISGKLSGFMSSGRNNILGWSDRISVNDKLTKLKDENLALMQENSSLKEKIKDSVNRFGFPDIEAKYNLVETKIIGKDNYFNTPLLYIILGKDRGLREGLPVLDSQGVLVGTIINCQEKISQIALTTSHESRLGARVAGTEWDGIVKGNRDLRAVMEMLPFESKLKKGDPVITDNRNPDIPEGIVIGTIDLIKESDDHLFNQTVLELPWDTSNMSKVWVITGRK